jgi:hypothetical protein
MASTYITQTISDGGNTKSTFSAWVKRSGLDSTQYLFHTSENTNNDVKIIFNSSNNLRVLGVVSGSTVLNLTTNRVFRDNSAFYHIVISFDLTQSTEADRIKMYINGVQETSFSTATYPSQNYSSLRLNNNGDRRTIGTIYDGGGSAGSGYFDGLLTHIHWTDNYAYAATDFGETDSTSGIWKAKPSPSITYGTNGFFLKFENSGNLDLDSSGNNLTFTTSGTLTQNVDTPSNNFCTMNPLDNYYFGGTFSNGNNTVQSASSSYSYCSSTIHVSSGKWYWEIKADSPDSSMRVGIGSKLATSTSDNLGNDTDGEAVVYPSGATKVNNVDDPNSWSGTSWTTGDILGFAMDLDNNKLYISKNGTFMNSGSPTSGSTGTGALSITAPASTPTGAYFVGWGDNNSSGTATMSHNFGNGYFGTTAVASANADGNGFGAFELKIEVMLTIIK